MRFEPCVSAGPVHPSAGIAFRGLVARPCRPIGEHLGDGPRIRCVGQPSRDAKSVGAHDRSLESTWTGASKFRHSYDASDVDADIAAADLRSALDRDVTELPANSAELVEHLEVTRFENVQ